MKSILKKIYKNNSFVRRIIERINGSKKVIRGYGNKVITSNSILKKVIIEVHGDNNEVTIGRDCTMKNCKIYVSGSNHKLEISNNTIIKSGELWFEDNNSKITIGSYVTIESAHIAVTEPNSNISIGDDCMISSGVDIRNGDSHSIIDIETGRRINYARDICIENHVWIGKDVEVLKGVTVGSNSIIGVRSVVTHNIPSNSIAVGSPAKVVKTNVNWDRQRLYN